MLTKVSSWVNEGIKSENNPIARLAGGKSIYELYTGKKPRPVQHYAKQALMAVGKVAALAIMSEIASTRISGLNDFISKGEDALIGKTVNILGKSTNPLAHSAIRISERIITATGTLLRR